MAPTTLAPSSHKPATTLPEHMRTACLGCGEWFTFHKSDKKVLRDGPLMAKCPACVKQHHAYVRMLAEREQLWEKARGPAFMIPAKCIRSKNARKKTSTAISKPQSHPLPPVVRDYTGPFTPEESDSLRFFRDDLETSWSTTTALYRDLWGPLGKGRTQEALKAHYVSLWPKKMVSTKGRFVKPGQLVVDGKMEIDDERVYGFYGEWRWGILLTTVRRYRWMRAWEDVRGDLEGVQEPLPVLETVLFL